MSMPGAYDRLPTGAKLLLLLSVALLPIGGALVWTSAAALQAAGQQLRDNADQDARQINGALGALIARNALALRLAANGAIRDGSGGAEECEEATRTLAIAPAVAHRFELEDAAGKPLCATDNFADLDRPPIAAPGQIRLWIARDQRSVLLRTGVVGGSATTRLPLDELRRAVETASQTVDSVTLEDGHIKLTVLDRPDAMTGTRLHRTRSPIGNGELIATIGSEVTSITTLERLIIILPVAMWALAALISWFLVTRLLIRPLRRLEAAVVGFEPGIGHHLALPDDLGPSTEIRSLGGAFARAVDRIELSENQMGEALEGQRKLVREVHHRVKNNLQVVASLLSIHGRMAEEPEAKAAYSAIGRRVDALAVVHRNHFAELEENQGIALRPMLSELATGLRASAPDAARGLAIELDIEHASTTQDAAVAVSFLVTEVVEFSMLDEVPAPIDIFLRRTSELTARLTLVSKSLLEDPDPGVARRQFDRIIEGLARQLRSPLDHKLGRYSVDLPIFPPHSGGASS